MKEVKPHTNYKGTTYRDTYDLQDANFWRCFPVYESDQHDHLFDRLNAPENVIYSMDHIPIADGTPIKSPEKYLIAAIIHTAHKDLKGPNSAHRQSAQQFLDSDAYHDICLWLGVIRNRPRHNGLGEAKSENGTAKL